jgi:hypothetical protein
VHVRSGLQLEQAVGSTGEKKQKRKPNKKKSLGKNLEERNKMDLNKIWKKKRGDTRAAPTIAAGQAHAADRDTMVM